MFPARNDYFDLLASLQKEYDGAVGIAMLHYCALFIGEEGAR